jgi:exopolysaccharide/PEP-CTERM locus tyrosine autokinase
MGKLTDALERRKEETVINTETFGRKRAPSRPFEGREISLAGDFSAGHEFSPKLVALTAPDSIDAENFKILKTRILFPKEGRKPNTIMVTSALPEEGKTFVAANLGASMALGVNEYVLLVDCDFRRPSLHNMLGYSNNQGLHEYLTGKIQLQDVIIRTGVEKLSLLTAGGLPSNPPELLSSNLMEALLRQVKGRDENRFIIFDAPPCQLTAEAHVLANYVDGIVFVVRATKSRREDIKKSVEVLGEEKIIGIVFNGYSERSKSYGKYYQKYYRDSG